MPWVVFVPVMKRKSKQLKSLSWRIRALLPLIVLVIIFLVAFQGCLFWFETAKQTDVKKQNSGELHRGYALSRTPTPVVPPSCSVPKFRDDGYVDDTVQCRRTAPTASSCKKAKEIYDNVEKVECVGHKEICTLKLNGDKPSFHCNPDLCQEGLIMLGTFRPNRELIWDQFESLKDMEDRVRQLLVTRDPSLDAGMAFVQCGADEVVFEDVRGYEDSEAMARYNALYNGEEFVMYEETSQFYKENGRSTQLLIFPNATKVIPHSAQRHGKLNINILFLDSVSHSHFFRMLPLTVEQLGKMDKSKDNLVFNFELMQSLKGRTFENQQALLSGLISGREGSLKAGVMFGAYKKNGYNVTWNEDLCWTWEWGLSRNFGFDKTPSKDRWNALRRATEKNSIDDIGATLTSCEILNFNGKNDPFHGLQRVCYNGRPHHWYILEYMKQMQSLMGRANRPYFQFTELNVGHDEHGLRIKSLDRDLQEYLEYLSTVEDTLTIIFSDHGNTYTKFASSTGEGRIEMVHPVMFFIAPKNFVDFVGRRGLKTLSVNQHRLVSLLDVHSMLMSFVNGTRSGHRRGLSDYDITERGLLEVISPSRTCHSIPLYPNTKCICKAETVNTTYRSSQLLLADFALGTLNNLIQEQYHKTSSRSNQTFGSCQKLQGISIQGVSGRLGRRNATQLEMQVVTQSGFPFKDQQEIFAFTVDIIWHNGTTFNISGYERISRFSKYEKCADTGVEKRLCVCDLRSNHSSTNRTFSADAYPLVFNQSSAPNRISKCLTVMERRRRAGLVLDALNLCSDTSVEFEISLSITENVLSSSKIPAKFTLHPHQNIFLIAFLAVDKTDRWAVKYSVNVTTTR